MGRVYGALCRNTRERGTLKDYLANKGHYPVKEYTTYGMYRSPFREESSPSFKVDYRVNLWYDFGSGEGGSIIDLVMKLHGCTLSQAIGLLENRVEISPLTQNDFERQVERREEMKIIEAVSLHHPNLLRYLQDRKKLKISIIPISAVYSVSILI